MVIDLEIHREEICDMFQHKSMKRVRSLIQEKYGLSASYVLLTPIGMSKLSLIDIANEPIGRGSRNGAHRNMLQHVKLN